MLKDLREALAPKGPLDLLALAAILVLLVLLGWLVLQGLQAVYQP